MGTSLVGLFIGQFAIGVLGALVISAGVRHGDDPSDLLRRATPTDRARRQAVVFGVVALVVAEVVAFRRLLFRQALLSASDPCRPSARRERSRQVIGSGLYVAILGLFALGLATIIRHTAGAIRAYRGILLCYRSSSPLLPSSLSIDVRRFLPDRIGAAMISPTSGPHVFTPWIGLLLLCGYAAVASSSAGCCSFGRDA